MSSSSVRIPSYRRHRPSGQAVVTLGGRDHYLGKHGSATSRAEYNRLIAEWTAHGGVIPESADLTVAELLAAFLRHAVVYYRGPDGQPTSEVANFKPVLARAKRLYGRTQAATFGPVALKAFRRTMVDDGLARRTVNHGVNRLRHVFKWGVANELVPPSVLQGLQAVAGLRFGRSSARETEPVRPVPDAFVDAVLPFVSPHVAAIIQLQRLTGMRSGEVTLMRGSDLNTQGKVWEFTPSAHKTAWRGYERKVYLGPRAQAVVRPFLKADMQAFLFSPADAEAERNSRLFGVVSASRKTKVYPSELRGRERRRAARTGRKHRERYTTETYLRAVKRGIERANVARLAEANEQGIDAKDVDLIPSWHPHQLRHNAATNLRREHGIEIARIILGHKSPAITEVYAEVDHARAIDVMALVG